MGSSSLYAILSSLQAPRLDSSKNLIFLSSSSVARTKSLFLFKNSLRIGRLACSSTNDVPNSVPSSGENIPSLPLFHKLEAWQVARLGRMPSHLIEGPETVQDFVQMQMQEIQDNIKSRRDKIFLLMEEVRRLRVQQRIKSIEVTDGMGEQENEMPDIPSSIPFLPHVTPKSLKQLHLTSFLFVSGIIVFGGLLAPVLELKLGLGGTSYEDFIRSTHLPMQLSQVDPIVASFSGGAVGVISALMLIEVNNVEQQEKKRCKYCHGSGYLACARCSGCGMYLKLEPIATTSVSNRQLHGPSTERCQNCSGSGKVMCPTCLCTGLAMASEHDPRIDPFD